MPPPYWLKTMLSEIFFVPVWFWTYIPFPWPRSVAPFQPLLKIRLP